MEEVKEYYEFDEIDDEGSAVVLDSTAFNGTRGQRSLFRRLEELVENPTRVLGPEDREGLNEGDRIEKEHLATLAFDIRNNDRYFTLDEIVQELQVYYRKIGENMKKLYDVLNLHPTTTSPFIGGVANVICACQNYAVPRASKIIQRNELSFGYYLNWLRDPQGMWVNIEDERERMQSRAQEMSEADRKVLALSLTLAEQRPTMLFTGDVNHIGYFARTIYFNEDSWLFENVQTPRNPLRVYAGFEKGWKLWVDSSKSPLVSK